MTYCLAVTLIDGIVFASDSRTNAGVDYVTSYSKMHTFKPAPDRFFVLLSAGSLATTQEVVSRIRVDIDEGNNQPNLVTVSELFEAAHYVGKMSRQVQDSHSSALSQRGVSGDATFILGGQIQGQPHGIFMVYTEGNFISASEETPYLQIGESKYGKPILDRLISQSLSLEEAARCSIMSIDSTIQANVTVGPPIELTLYQRDSFTEAQHLCLKRNDPFYIAMREGWHQGLTQAFNQLPRFEWESNPNQIGTESGQTSPLVKQEPNTASALPTQASPPQQAPPDSGQNVVPPQAPSVTDGGG